MRIRLFAATGAVLSAALLTAACGSDTDDAAGSGVRTVSVTVEGVGQVTTDPAVAAKLPRDIRDKGSIVVATNAPYEPFIDFAVEGQSDRFKGLDHDLLQAAGAKLGITTTFLQQPFDGLVPGLQAGKYDAIAGGVTDKKERQQVATFVDYSASGTGFLVRPGTAPAVTSVADLCGRRVAVQKASNQAKHLADYGKSSCAGRAIDIKEYPDNPQTVTALLAGNVDAVAATKTNLVDAAEQQPGKVTLVADAAHPNGWLASPNGFGFSKSRGDLAVAYQAAVQALIDDGTYGKILDRWKQKPIGIAKATIDQAVD
jgi:polar amino acid transport system substrate-binding protein